MGIEGFLSFEDSIDLVEQLVHDGSDDLHFLFAFMTWGQTKYL
jgi:hypothetical protein